MAAPPPPASFEDDAWSQYAQAPAYHSQHQQHYQQPGVYASTSTAPYPDAAGVDAGLMVAPPSSFAAAAPRDAAYYGQSSGGGGLRIDGYADPTYTFAPQRSHSSGTTPSPALPALSPASSISTSSGFVSPHQVFSAGESPEQYRIAAASGSAGLLPPASIQDGGQQHFYTAAGKGNSGWFAEMQESYLMLQQEQPSYGGASSYALTSAPSVPPPSTPRRHAPSSAHLWRSPSGYSVASSSPTTSPYHRPTTPRLAPGTYPSDLPTPTGPSGRRGSTGGLIGDSSPSSSLSRPRSAARRAQGTPVTVVDALGSPTKSVRRPARLSIEVPPAGHGLSSSTTGAPPPPQPVFLSPAQQPRPVQQYQQQPVEADPGLSEASVREVEQLLGELGTILETGGVYEHQDMPMPPQPFQPQRRVELAPAPPGRPRVAAGAYQPQQQQQPISEDVFAPTSISISGVTLAEEDLALLDTPSLGAGDNSGEFQPLPPSPERGGLSHRAYPSSAPAWKTSFDMPPPPPPRTLQRAKYDYPEPDHLAYAPPSPVHAPQPSPHFLPQPPQQHVSFRPSSAPRDSAHMLSPVAAGRRRRSSVDTAAIASSSHLHAYSPYPHPPTASPSRSHRFVHPSQQQQHQHEYQQPYISQHPQYLQQSPSRPPLPARSAFASSTSSAASGASPAPTRRPPSLDFPTVLRPAPPPGSEPLESTPPPSPTKASGSGAAASPAGSKSTPKRKKAGPSKPKPAVSMFINFSAKDSKKLLSGVAPSGSTKKKREEEEAAAAARAAAGGGAPAASSSTSPPISDAAAGPSSS